MKSGCCCSCTTGSGGATVIDSSCTTGSSGTIGSGVDDAICIVDLSGAEDGDGVQRDFAFVSCNQEDRVM